MFGRAEAVGREWLRESSLGDEMEVVCSVCVELVDRVFSMSLPEAESLKEYCSWAYTDRRKSRNF